MKTEDFSQTQLEHIMTSISANKRQIDELEVENEAKYNELDTFIQHKLISLNWKPKYNEKVINIALAAQTAWHLWFIERRDDIYRFQKAPLDFPYNNNLYYLQSVIPEAENESHSWIIPLSLFEEIESIIPFRIYADRHKDFRW